jgi:hypothetical protein
MYEDMQSFYNDTNMLIHMLRMNGYNEYSIELESALAGSTGGEIVGALNTTLLKYKTINFKNAEIQKLLECQREMIHALYKQYYE